MPADREPVRTITHSYGGWILLTDLAAVGLATVTGGVSLVAYPLGGPLIHAGKGNGKGALASLGTRVAAPALGAVIGYKIETADGCGGSLCGLMGGITGMVLGALTASIVDASYFAHVDRPVPARAARSMPVPTLAISRGGGLLVGAAGRF